MKVWAMIVKEQVEMSVIEWVEHWLSEGKVQGSNPSAANAGSVTARV